MKSVTLGTVSLGAVALWSFVGIAAAQSASSPILNSLEVRRLVASAQPADNVRLSAHFAALADQYTTDAKKHDAMAQIYKGTTNRQLSASMGVHCAQLAEIDRQSAVALRELAAYHEQLGKGVTSTPPAGAARFESGSGAPDPTDQQVRALAANAKTQADHRALEQYFLALAKQYKAAETEHATMVVTYRGSRIASGAAHCDRLVKLSRDGAKEASAAAAIQKQLAEIAGK
jgi:hypothetical protein